MADEHGSASELKVRQNISCASCIQGGGSVEVDLVRQRGVAAETLTYYNDLYMVIYYASYIS